jgi:Dienelactone hydrolase family
VLIVVVADADATEVTKEIIRPLRLGWDGRSFSAAEQCPITNTVRIQPMAGLLTTIVASPDLSPVGRTPGGDVGNDQAASDDQNVAIARVALENAGVTHDVKEYPAASHAFLNDAETGPRALRPLLRVAGIGPEPDSAKDAWDRIERFFVTHLH